MKDIQNKRDSRRISIHKVGINGLRYPVTVLDRADRSQQTIANINMYVDLPHGFKGTHMSRFLEIINTCGGRISINGIKPILEVMKERFDCKSAHLEMRFPYFMRKAAPVSGAKSLLDFDCAFLASLERKGRRDIFDLIVEVKVPVTTLCPCSRAISKHGAHNQRSLITIRVRTCKLVWFEELIEMGESAASAPLYSLLKRADEKYITEQAFDNPRFVEDVVRNVAVKLKKDRRVTWFSAESENQESIHNHNAYAMVTGGTY